MRALTKEQKVFSFFNYIVMIFLGLTCVLPFIHILAISLSSSDSVAAGAVLFLPKEFTLAPYKYVIGLPQIPRSFMISTVRVILGTAIALAFMVLAAYPMSKPKQVFKRRNLYLGLILVPMFFSGGLIPAYMLLNQIKMLDTIWALILPCAVSSYNIILMANFFKRIPASIEESALIDGASYFKVLIRIVIPMSTASIATMALFAIVFHWNSWFDGLIYMNSPANYPLQSYLQTIIIKLDPAMMTEDNLDLIKLVSARTNRAAQIFFTTLPVLLVYPFLQKYFVTGMTLGAVKG